jgi:4-amino-4-deoxy-L-arabinose transferase-like glycosyltransferase
MVSQHSLRQPSVLCSIKTLTKWMFLMDRVSSRMVLGLVLLAYGVLGALYAARTPAWQVPDEPAHYNYIGHLAQEGCCPIIAQGDWDNAYLESIKAAQFSTEALAGRLTSIDYEDHQPPLYYVLAVPVFALTNGDLLAMRLFSVLLASGVIIGIWGAARNMGLPVYVAALAAASAGFLPQFLAMVAGVNNDALALPIAALTLSLLCAYVCADQPPRYCYWGILLLLGAAFLTKLTVYPLAGCAGLAVLIRVWRTRAPFGQAIKHGLIFLLPALIMAAPFWGRNLATYPGFDPLAQAAHDRVVVGQLTRADYVAEVGETAWRERFASTLFNSFWGQFGWMAVPLPGWMYQALLAACGMAGLGLLIGLLRWRPSRRQSEAALLLGLMFALTAGAVLWYNLKFVQFQGRYLYPALTGIALLWALGWSAWGAWLGAFSRRPWLAWLWSAAIAIGMAVFAAYALWRILIPGLAG